MSLQSELDHIVVDEETMNQIKANQAKREVNIKLSYDDLKKYAKKSTSLADELVIDTTNEVDKKDPINIDVAPTSPHHDSTILNNTINKKESVPELQIRYHKEYFPSLPEVKKLGNFIDLYNAQRVELKKGQFVLLNLGVSVKIPEGYWMQIVPRSSTFKKYGIIQVNSFGVIDDTYCGDNDILMMPVYAVKDTVIPVNERVCQFTLHKEEIFEIKEVPILFGPDRGGFGSTGTN